jgi:predicted PurR-regulated permease PerM
MVLVGSLLNGDRLLISVLFLALILAVADLLIVTGSIVLLVFAGLLFGVLLYGVSNWLAERTAFSRNFAYFFVVAALLAIIAAGFFYLGSQIVLRWDKLWTEMIAAVENGQKWLKDQGWSASVLPTQDEVESMVKDADGQILPRMLDGITWLGWGLTGAFVILFVGLYAAYDPGLYKTGVVKLFPLERRPRIAEVTSTLGAAMRRWILGRMMSMTFVGVLTAIGMWFLEVPMYGTLGVLAALLTFIPNIGPLLAAVPQVLLAINSGGNTVLYVIVFNLVLEGVESYLVTPLIQQHEVSLPPIVTIAAQLLSGALLGIIGLMMAAPLVVVLTVLIQMLYIEDRLGDPNPGELTSNQPSS